MFVRLTGSVRVKAGWFAALLYLFCVLAPGAALALGDAAACLMTEIGTTAAAHQHDHAQPAHTAGSAHQHHDAHHHADAGNTAPDHARHQHDGKGPPGPCCAMLCVSAITADLPAIVKPLQPVSVCVSENSQRLLGEAPPLRYRPPIA